MKFKSYLINEGVMEAETTAISRAIIDVLKANWEQFENLGILLMQYGKVDPSLHGSYAPIQQLNIKQYAFNGIEKMPNIFVLIRAGKNTRSEVKGTFVPSHNLLKVMAVFQPRQENLILLVNDLKDTLRHELEHKLQPRDMLAHGMNATKEFHKEININSVINYYTSPAEVAAWVAGIYKTAKSNHIPFTIAVKDIINKLGDGLLGRGFKKQIVNDTVKQIESKWLDYARQRFPKAY